MPIGFRCTGCRARLHVPSRWTGTTVPCPKCGTRVVVPATASALTGAFEHAAVERSLATLQAPAARSAGGIFAEEAFELPVGGGEDATPPSAGRWTAGITLPWGAVYAYAAAVPIVAALAFLLGCWWAATGTR
jgi:predicted RNA-binding Zn-ribbon protein involved in translation (DUF1610 family)